MRPLGASAAPPAWRRLLRRLLHVDLWNVGLVRAPIQAFLRPGFRPEVLWLPADGKARLSADPFGLARDGRVHVLYEALEFAEGRGFLVARELGPGGFGPERTVLCQPFHMSYPFLLEHEGEVYCVPETCAAGEVALYRARAFPAGWEKVATLLEGFAGVDSTLLRHEGRWWCFATEKGDAHATRLKLFHAAELRGPWIAHVRNPVKEDVRSARCGGTPFRHDGQLYRPAQDYSRKIEERLTLNRIVRLDPEAFEEETVLTLEPLAGEPYPDKFHTLSAVGDWTLVDGCREVCVLTSPTLLAFKVRRALAALLGRRRGDGAGPGAPGRSAPAPGRSPAG